MDNTVSVVGRLVAEPELRFVGEGVPMTTFRILQTPRVKQGNAWVDGEPRGFDVVCWRQLAERVALLPKGLLIRVSGQMAEDRWEDKTTQQMRTKHKVNADAVDISVFGLRDIEPSGDGELRVVYKGGADKSFASPKANAAPIVPTGVEPALWDRDDEEPF